MLQSLKLGLYNFITPNRYNISVSILCFFYIHIKKLFLDFSSQDCIFFSIGVILRKPKFQVLVSMDLTIMGSKKRPFSTSSATAKSSETLSVAGEKGVSKVVSFWPINVFLSICGDSSVRKIEFLFVICRKMVVRVGRFLWRIWKQ